MRRNLFQGRYYSLHALVLVLLCSGCYRHDKEVGSAAHYWNPKPACYFESDGTLGFNLDRCPENELQSAIDRLSGFARRNNLDWWAQTEAGPDGIYCAAVLNSKTHIITQTQCDHSLSVAVEALIQNSAPVRHPKRGEHLVVCANPNFLEKNDCIRAEWKREAADETIPIEWDRLVDTRDISDLPSYLRGCGSCFIRGGKVYIPHYSCRDTTRFLLQSEDAELHCLKLVD